jgi:hypothetical protein
MIGYVYVIKFTDSGGLSYYKIGITGTTVEDRINGIKTSIPFRLQIVKSFKCKNYKLLEKNLHKKYEQFKVINEWFCFKEKELEFIIEISTFNTDGY